MKVISKILFVILISLILAGCSSYTITSHLDSNIKEIAGSISEPENFNENNLTSILTKDTSIYFYYEEGVSTQITMYVFEQDQLKHRKGISVLDTEKLNDDVLWRYVEADDPQQHRPLLFGWSTANGLLLHDEPLVVNQVLINGYNVFYKILDEPLDWPIDITGY